MARVTLEKVSKTYPGANRPIVSAIDLDVLDHEFIVLVGPSGCGKSTTLRMIAGLEDITSGKIWIGDREVNDIPPKDRDIAMVFQNYALYPHMSVYKNMAFGLELRRRELNLTKGEIHKRVLEVAESLGITEHLQRKPRVLSGGQKQRVALGRAIIRNPKAFLFDEPLSNLDAKLRVETRAEIKRLHLRLQTTTIYVTHDQEEAMTLGDRIAVLNNGIIQQLARPLEVYERPVNRFVAGFIGTPPMNFLSGIVADNSYFLTGNQRLKLPPKFDAVLNAKIGKNLIMGIRPESISPGNTGKFAGSDNALIGRVLLVEPLGDKIDIRFDAQTIGSLLCRADAYAFGDIHVGQTASFYIDLTRVHLFDDTPEGLNLTPTAPIG